MESGEAIIRSAGELGLRVESVETVSDLLGAVYGLDGLILHGGDLGPEFFRLHSGLAAELFQKLVNFRIPAVLVLPDFAAHGERFAELASEHAHHPHVRFVHTEAEAWAWMHATIARQR